MLTSTGTTELFHFGLTMGDENLFARLKRAMKGSAGAAIYEVLCIF